MAPRLLVVIAVCSVFLLTHSEKARAYTINTTETGKRIRWGTDTVALRVQPAFERFLDHAAADAALEMALDAWRGLPRVPDLVLQPDAPNKKPGHAGGAPSNGVYLLERWPYEPKKLAITVITYEMETGRLLDADILVNGQTKFALLDEHAGSDKEHYDLAAVLTHELGHVLGLGESGEAPDATMWPYAAPGETQKRTLAEDDEDGVIESYLSSPPKPAGGCGPMTVAGRRGAPTWLAGLVVLLMCLSLRAGRRTTRLWRALWPVSVMLLIFGFGTPPSAATHRAADSPRTIDDARGESARLLATQTNRERMRQLQGAAPALLRGRAQKLGTVVDEDGLFFTEYTVKRAEGGETRLRVMGGARGGIGQRALDGEEPPRDGAQIVVATQPDGTQRWAFATDGKLFGGYLGEGSAILGEL